MTEKHYAGERIGELVLLEKIPYRTPSGKMKSKWRCKCSCGAVTEVFAANLNRTKSCGHLIKKHLSEKHLHDLTGQVFSWLTVKERGPDRISSSGRHIVRWKCVCECGNEILADGAELQKGSVKSCGCHRHDYQGEDLSGKIFNSLLVLERMPSIRYGSSSQTKWKCRCLECGSDKIVYRSALMRGQMTCGCINSRGEYEIGRILQQLNIQFQRGYSFPDLLSPRYGTVYFDFALRDSDNNMVLIEYQGEQHYIPQSNHFGDYQREVTDPLKKQYCKTHNIPLYEIRYDEPIEESLMNILNKAHVNPVPSSKEKV